MHRPSWFLSSLHLRLTMGLALVAAVLGMLAAASVLSMREINGRIQEVGEETTTELTSATQLASLVKDAESSLLRYVVSGDPVDAERSRQANQAALAAFQEARTGLFGSDAERQMIEEGEREFAAAAGLAADVVQSPDPAKSGVAIEFEAHVRAAEATLTELEDEVTAEADEEISDTRALAQRTNLVTLALLAIGLAAAILGTKLVPRSALGPISRLTSAMRRVADGEVIEHIPPSSIRELDELGDAFNVMVTRLRGRTDELLAQIAERAEAEDRVRHLALHDGLTDLPNRTLFRDRLDLALAQARRSRQPLGVIFVDLDRFKLVNDTAGHGAGDLLLKGVATRLRDVLREGDTLARSGGDEFTVLVSGISRAEDTADIAERLVGALRLPVSVNGRDFHVTASMGISVFPDDGEDAPTLLRKADTALYFAKDQGRNNFQFYASASEAKIGDRLVLVDELRSAVDRDELVLHYQPLIDAGSGAVSAVEALVRWQHPRRGLVPPDLFIPIAEESGLICAIGEWVLRKACGQNRAWQDAGIRPVRVAVNVSVYQLHEADLVETVRRCLQDTGMAPEFLRLEITESAFITNPAKSARVLGELRAMGIEIAIDDFGTGYSSLSRLHELPIDELKIDRSFIRGIGTSANDGALASVVVNLARSLQIAVTAEGVETVNELEFLRSRGCDNIQGYLYSPPVSAGAVQTLLGETRVRHAA